MNRENVLVSGADNGGLWFWDYKSGHSFQQHQTQPQPGSLDAESGIFAMTFDQTGSRLLTAETDKSIKIYREDENAVRRGNGGREGEEDEGAGMRRRASSHSLQALTMAVWHGLLRCVCVTLYRPRRHIRSHGDRASVASDSKASCQAAPRGSFFHSPFFSVFCTPPFCRYI